MKGKKIAFICVLIIILGICGYLLFGIKKNNKQDENKIKVVASNFASYDFLRAIIGDNKNVDLTFLLGPGKDAHSYDPTAKEIIEMQNADLLVYIGGEMESWSDKVLQDVDKNKVKVVCISESVQTIEETEIDGAEPEEEEEEEEGAFDEHIWTSPKNAINMVTALKQEMQDLDKENSQKYEENANAYIEKIKNIDNQIQEIVDNKKRDTLVFGDKMPMQYFINQYNLKVSAAFSGCSTETEPSANTISYLVKKAKNDNIPVILYCELGNGKVANTIADEVGNDCKAMQIQTLHNLSKEDFDNGETWVSLMTRNLNVLKSALQ